MKHNLSEVPEHSKEQAEGVRLDPNNFMRAIDLLEQIEGKYWANKQELLFTDERLKDDPDNYTLRAALNAVAEFKKYVESLRIELESTKDGEERTDIEEIINKYENGFGPKAEIYGDGGQNRYQVLSNGELVAIGSCMKDIKKVKELGVRII